MPGPDFWAWMSGSKVVAEDGRPLVVHHGSDDPRCLSGVPPMTHFGTAAAARDRLLQFSGRLPWGWTPAYEAALAHPDLAPQLDRLRFESGVAREGHAYHAYRPGSLLMPAYLRIERPVAVYDDGQPHTPEVMAAHLARSWRFYEEVGDRMEEWELDAALDALKRKRGWGPMIRFLRDLGYDGMSYANVVEDRRSVSWVVFDQSQVWPAFADAPFEPAASPRRARAP